MAPARAVAERRHGRTGLSVDGRDEGDFLRSLSRRSGGDEGRHGAPQNPSRPGARYSEDIDLVIVGDRPEGHIKKALKRVLARVLGEPSENMFDTVKLAVRNLLRPSRIIRQVYPFNPTTGGEVMEVKVEANCEERIPFYAVVDLEHPMPDGSLFPVRSYDLDEMLGTKMRALLQRDQGRDIFDLWWALTQPTAFFTPEPGRIIEAFQHYMDQEGTTVTYDHFAAEIDRKLKIPGFRTDVDVFLRPGLPKYDIDAAASYLMDKLISLLRDHHPRSSP